VGHAFDLEDLPLWLAGHEFQVVQREDDYFLQIPGGLIGEHYEPVRGFAEAQLELINGVGKIARSDFRPVRLSDKLFGVDTSGNIRDTVVAVESGELRLKAGTVVVKVGDRTLPDPREGFARQFLAVASHSSAAHDALVVMGRHTLTWSELYLLFELVEADVGSRMVDLGWISKADANLFSWTANSYTALRQHGRHGKNSGSPPPTPMSVGNATTVIRSLVRSWLSNVAERSSLGREAG
jgi:hypothetical protein